MENRIASASVDIRPRDHRCRYWAKIIRAGEPLPMPETVDGANDVPGAYLRRGEDELLPGDVLVEGEENHYRKMRGWTYRVTWCDDQGEARSVVPTASTKARLKEQGMDVSLLKGSGGVAAAIRVCHALRLGMEVK